MSHILYNSCKDDSIIYTLFTELVDDHGAVMNLQSCAWSMQTNSAVTN